MALELGNFKYDGNRFFIDGKYIKLSRLRYNLLKILCDEYSKKPVSVNKILEAMYDDIDDRRDEPQTKSYRVIICTLRKMLHRHTDNKLTICANKDVGYSLEYNANQSIPIKRGQLSKKDIQDIIYKHNSGMRATSIATEYAVSKHRIYDLLIRSKQDKLLKEFLGDDYDKKNYTKKRFH